MSPPGPSSFRVQRALVVATVLATAALWLVRVAPIGELAWRVALCEGAMVPIAVASMIAIWLTPAATELDAATRSAWRLLASAATVWSLTGVVWELLGRPRVSVADALQLTFFPLVIAGVFRFPAAVLTRGGRVRFWLDSAIVVLAGAAALWYLTVWPGIVLGDGDRANLVVNAVLYPAGDLVLLFAACAGLLRGHDGASRRALVGVAAALVARFVGDLVISWRIVTGRDEGAIADLLWLTGATLLAVAAAAQRRGSTRASGVLAPGTSAPAAAPRQVSLLPYGAAIALFGFLVVVTRGALGARAGGVLAAALGVAVLVLARQWLATRDNERLHRAHAEREAERRVEARFRSLVQHSSDVIIVADRAGLVHYASPSVERVLGVARLALESSLLALVHPDDVGRAETMLVAATRRADDGTVAAATQFRAAADGEWRDVECLATDLSDDPNVRGIVVTMRDVTERARLEAQLVHQAYHDPLTGLANRALFRDRVSHALTREQRAPAGVVVLFLDLDDFKTVNDSLGHREGDRLLAVVAERLLNATRGCDTVARLGGDEFAVLVEHARTDDEVVVVAERIVGAIRAPIALGTHQVTVGASIGIARARLGDGAEELLRNADVAMYKAKQRGTNAYEIFAPAMHAALVDRLELEGELRRALGELEAAQAGEGGAGRTSEFLVVYQPIVSLADRLVVGVEALARWRHPTRGFVPPSSFIPIAESTGLIVPFGRWILRAACAQAARWHAAAARDEFGGRAAEPLAVTVNLSARQLLHPSIVDDVRAALADARLAPASLVLEITESVIVQNTSASLATLHALKALGVRLAIDDFGTGYSSLSYLEQFPLDILKIDKSFVDGVAHGGSRAALARTVVALGDSLSLRCVAEGIESDDQREHLLALGCAYGQGYLFARPLPAEEVETLLRDAVGAVGAAA